MSGKKAKTGVVTHFYNHLGVGSVKLRAPLHIGDHIHIQGHTTSFDQTVSHLQLNHKDVASGKKGDEVGMQVDNRVREGDAVYLE